MRAKALLGLGFSFGFLTGAFTMACGLVVLLATKVKTR